VTESDKPLVWMNTEVQSTPFSREARLEAGFLLKSCKWDRNWKCLIRGQCQLSAYDDADGPGKEAQFESIPCSKDGSRRKLCIPWPFGAISARPWRLPR